MPGVGDPDGAQLQDVRQGQHRLDDSRDQARGKRQRRLRGGVCVDRGDGLGLVWGRVEGGG